jgi:hypothetical protein
MCESFAISPTCSLLDCDSEGLRFVIAIQDCWFRVG